MHLKKEVNLSPYAHQKIYPFMDERGSVFAYPSCVGAAVLCCYDYYRSLAVVFSGPIFGHVGRDARILY